MLWRQVVRVATREVAFSQYVGVLIGNRRPIEYPKRTNYIITNFSTLSDGNSRAGPLKSDALKDGSKKKDIRPKITMIGTDESISVVALEDGQKLAKRRNLRLVKMVEFDGKAQRPVYRLMSISEYNEEYKKEKASKGRSLKREKLVTFTSRISDHDIQSKVKMMGKWLANDHEIRVVITGDANDMSGSEEVYKKLESHFKETSRFLQKRQVNADIKFSIKSLSGSKSSSVPKKEDPKQTPADLKR